MMVYFQKNSLLSILFGLSFISPSSFGQMLTTHQEAPREKIGLVLSGGGARGLAHLGVLKALEERHIPIDYIAGTSAGALIGGMYASGMSIGEIESKIKDLDLGEVAFAPTDRRTLTQDARNLDYQANTIVDVSVTRDGKVALPVAVSNGAKVESVLRSLLKNQPYNTDFEKLPIPFNAVAADLATGKMVVLKNGQLAQSLRASMAIPAVFTPVETDGKILVDGMIARNLPIDVARNMGATRVIAVDVGSELPSKDTLNSVVAVSEQLLSLLVKRNVDEQVATLTHRDILIRPNLGDIGNLDFKKGSQASALGYQHMQKAEIQNQLNSFTVSNDYYKIFMAKHALSQSPDILIDYVRIETHGLARPASLQDELHMKDGQKFNIETVNQDINRLLTAGRISNVQYRVDKVGDKIELVYDVTEKDESHNALRAGFEVSSNDISDQQFTLNLAHRNVWLNALGGEWRNNLILGKRTSFSTLLNQPLNNTGNIFIRPYASISYKKQPAYKSNSSQVATEYATNQQTYGFLLGTPIKRIGEWGVGLSYRHAHLKENANNPDLVIPDDQFKQATLDAELTLDQLNDAFIPTQGYYVHAYAHTGLTRKNNHRYFSAGARGTYAFSHNVHSVALTAEVSGHNNESSVYLSPYTLGGYHHLSGYANNQFIGNYMAFASLTYRYRTPFSILNNPLVVGASLEAGNTWKSARDINGRLKYSGSLFGALRTPIGPAQFGVGLTESGKASVYFFLGRTFTDTQ